MKLIKPSQLSFNTCNSEELNCNISVENTFLLTNHPRVIIALENTYKNTCIQLAPRCKAYPRLSEIWQQAYVILVRNSFHKRLVEIISTWLHTERIPASYKCQNKNTNRSQTTSAMQMEWAEITQAKTSSYNPPPFPITFLILSLLSLTVL